MVSFLRGYLNEGGVRVWSERNKLEKLVMENYSDENFLEVKAKHSPDEVLQRWRNLCSVVKNPKRRFRHTANLSKSGEAAAMQRTNQEKLRIAVLVSKAAFQFIQGLPVSDHIVPEEVKTAGFQICADELGSIVEGHDVKKLKIHGGVDCIAEKLSTYKMMITAVGMRTQWGKLMATFSEGGDDETPLQVKLNGVATFIGKIGLAFAVVTFAVLVQGLFNRKLGEGTQNSESML